MLRALIAGTAAQSSIENDGIRGVAGAWRDWVVAVGVIIATDGQEEKKEGDGTGSECHNCE